MKEECITSGYCCKVGCKRAEETRVCMDVYEAHISQLPSFQLTLTTSERLEGPFIITSQNLI